MRPVRSPQASTAPTAPLTICHVLWSVEFGGAERVVLDLAREQKSAGHEVTVVTLSTAFAALTVDMRRAAGALECVPKRGRGVDLSLPIRLARWMRARGVQIVHTHNEMPLIYGAPAGKLAGASVVHSKHGVVPVRRTAHWLRRAAALAADRFVAVSQATAETALANHECLPRKLRVVVNGTDLSRFPAPADARARIRRELGIPIDACVLTSVGRLVKEKNHALLLRAAAPQLRDDRRLVIVGDGPLRDELRARVASLENGRFVHLTGARRDVPELLSASDAYVLSSDSEGLPIGILEAWAAGLPVIATAVGGIPAAVQADVTGWLVPPGEEAPLGAALRRVFEADAALRPMAERGRAHVLSTYSAGAMAGAYFALYEECLRARPQAGA